MATIDMIMTPGHGHIAWEQPREDVGKIRFPGDELRGMTDENGI